jgi:hypothetical protein
VNPFEALIYLGRVRRLIEVAPTAFGGYGLSDACLRFFARSGNASLRVDAASPRDPISVAHKIIVHCIKQEKIDGIWR